MIYLKTSYFRTVSLILFCAMLAGCRPHSQKSQLNYLSQQELDELIAFIQTKLPAAFFIPKGLTNDEAKSLRTLFSQTGFDSNELKKTKFIEFVFHNSDSKMKLNVRYKKANDGQIYGPSLLYVYPKAEVKDLSGFPKRLNFYAKLLNMLSPLELDLLRSAPAGIKMFHLAVDIDTTSKDFSDARMQKYQRYFEDVKSKAPKLTRSITKLQYNFDQVEYIYLTGNVDLTAAPTSFSYASDYPHPGGTELVTFNLSEDIAQIESFVNSMVAMKPEGKRHEEQLKKALGYDVKLFYGQSLRTQADLAKVSQRLEHFAPKIRNQPAVGMLTIWDEDDPHALYASQSHSTLALHTSPGTLYRDDYPGFIGAFAAMAEQHSSDPNKFKLLFSTRKGVAGDLVFCKYNKSLTCNKGDPLYEEATLVADAHGKPKRSIWTTKDFVTLEPGLELLVLIDIGGEVRQKLVFNKL